MTIFAVIFFGEKWSVSKLFCSNLSFKCSLIRARLNWNCLGWQVSWSNMWSNTWKYFVIPIHVCWHRFWGSWLLPRPWALWRRQLVQLAASALQWRKSEPPQTTRHTITAMWLTNLSHTWIARSVQVSSGSEQTVVNQTLQQSHPTWSTDNLLSMEAYTEQTISKRLSIATTAPNKSCSKSATVLL